jgi:hypothetical protein
MLWAACSPSKAGEEADELTDRLGWETYSNDWRNFFECMLAPVAQQAAGPSHASFGASVLVACWCLVLSGSRHIHCLCDAIMLQATQQRLTAERNRAQCPTMGCSSPLKVPGLIFFLELGKQCWTANVPAAAEATGGLSGGC